MSRAIQENQVTIRITGGVDFEPDWDMSDHDNSDDHQTEGDNMLDIFNTNVEFPNGHENISIQGAQEEDALYVLIHSSYLITDDSKLTPKESVI